MHRWSHFASWIHFFNFLDAWLENFKQLVLGLLDVHFGRELHEIHHHLTNKNQYFDFHSILNHFLHHFQNLTLSCTPTGWGRLKAPKGCPIRKYSGECFASFQIQFVTFRRGHPGTPIDSVPVSLPGIHCSTSHFCDMIFIWQLNFDLITGAGGTASTRFPSEELAEPRDLWPSHFVCERGCSVLSFPMQHKSACNCINRYFSSHIQFNFPHRFSDNFKQLVLANLDVHFD